MDAESIIHLGGGVGTFMNAGTTIHLGGGCRDLYGCRDNNTPGRGV